MRRTGWRMRRFSDLCGVLRIYAANGGRMPRSRDLCGKWAKNSAFLEDMRRAEISE